MEVASDWRITDEPMISREETMGLLPSNDTNSTNLGPIKDEQISAEELKKASMVITIILTLISLCGCIGNILSLVVLFQKRMRNCTNYFLAALAISDLLFLVHCLMFVGIMVHRKIDPVMGAATQARAYPIFGAYGSIVCARITSWMTVLLSIERFIAVYRPMQAKNILNSRNTVLAIATIYLLTIVSFIPFLLKYTYKEKTVRNLTILETDYTEFGRNKTFFKVYGMLLNIIFRFLPIVIVMLLNFRIIVSIRKMYKLRYKMSGHNGSTHNSSRSAKSAKSRSCHSSTSDQRHITKMLIIVFIIFLIFISPGALNSILTHVWPGYSRIGKMKNLYRLVSSITYLLETINSSVNFVVYMFLSKKFYITFQEVFCCKKRYKNIQSSINSRSGGGSQREKFLWTSRLKSAPDGKFKGIPGCRSDTRLYFFNHSMKNGYHGNRERFLSQSYKDETSFNENSKSSSSDMQQNGYVGHKILKTSENDDFSLCNSDTAKCISNNFV